jgi:hypothetical protein
MIQIAPTLYPIFKKEAFRSREIECATLFRNMNEPRRKYFFEKLIEHNIPVQNINNIFNGIEFIYKKIKILINIKQTDHHDTLEELRVLPAIRCGVIVISESVPLQKECRYSDFVVWGKLEELPNIVRDVLSNYANYHQRIFATDHFQRRMQRLELANYLHLKRALNQEQVHHSS